jgi:maleylacetate reductase
MDTFTYSGSASRILFGSGTVRQIAEEVERLGCKNTLVLSTLRQRDKAEEIAERLGSLACGIFIGAVMHTPVDVTDVAMAEFRRLNADGVVSIGGGTTVGLGKAIAYHTDAPQSVIATTYAGSEVTPILGQTESGVKTTVRDARILPETVIYDPDLTIGLPVAISVSSGLNAIAHAVEGLYAIDRNPITSLIAVEGVRALHAALPRIVLNPGDSEARHEALYGAWLCGTVLGTVGMALHHKLCHVLGGSFHLPHAETHAVMLPYSVAYNAKTAVDELRPLQSFFTENLGAGLKAFAAELDAPLSLAAIGLRQADVEKAAAIAMRNPYSNPRPLEPEAMRELLERAWLGIPPA